MTANDFGFQVKTSEAPFNFYVATTQQKGAWGILKGFRSSGFNP
jgi:hypothetical protein